MSREILAIIGSAGRQSSNRKLVDYIAELIRPDFNVTIFEGLQSLPHFDVAQSNDTPPDSIRAFRTSIENAAGVIICTPEYVFSIPSGLKNAMEWCVAATVFTDKPVGLITASADGQKGHEELQLIMRTLMAKISNDTTLLISGIKGKISADGQITDPATTSACRKFIESFNQLLPESSP